MVKRRIIFLVYEGFELLDLSGPLAVFEGAAMEGGYVPPIIVSETGRCKTGVSGLEIVSTPMSKITPTKRDTVFVVGAQERALRRAAGNSLLRSWLQEADMNCERIGSICSGAFILAETGILSSKAATTHWSGVEVLKEDYPDIRVDMTAIYVADGRVWTSAGVTTGLDMALEIVRRDIGEGVARRIAKQLVVSAHRLGNQSQFSQTLDLQFKFKGLYASLHPWLVDNLAKPIKVKNMADQVGLSERTFYRKFSADMGVTPSKFVERFRLSTAKDLIEQNMPLKQVTAQVGFRSEAGFRKAFEDQYGMLPRLYRRMQTDLLNQTI